MFFVRLLVFRRPNLVLFDSYTYLGEVYLLDFIFLRAVVAKGRLLKREHTGGGWRDGWEASEGGYEASKGGRCGSHTLALLVKGPGLVDVTVGSTPRCSCGCSCFLLAALQRTTAACKRRRVRKPSASPVQVHRQKCRCSSRVEGLPLPSAAASCPAYISDMAGKMMCGWLAALSKIFTPRPSNRQYHFCRSPCSGNWHARAAAGPLTPTILPPAREAI